MAKEVGIRLTADAQQAVKSFDDTSKSMQGISRSAKSLTVDGADTAKILASIGERGGQAFKELINTQQQEGRSLKEIQQAVQALAQEQSKAAKAGKQGYLEEAQAAAILKQREAERAQGIADFGRQVSNSLGSMNSTLQHAGSEMASLQRQMAMTFGAGDAANGVVKIIRDLDDEVGMTEQSLGQAAVTLQKFGVYSDQNLTRAAIAAKKTGQSVEEVATAIGKFEKFGDSRSRTTLMKMLGLAPEDMASAQSALDAIDAKFGTTTDGMVSKAALAKGEIGDLLQEIGVHGVQATNQLYESYLPLAKALHQMPEGFKQVAGEAVSLGSTVTSLGSAGLQAAANFNMAGLSMQSVWAAVTGPLGLALLAITGVAAAVRLGISAMDEQNAKINAQTAAYEQQNKTLRENRDIRLAIAEGKAVDLPKATETRNAYLEREKQLLKEIGELEQGNIGRRFNKVSEDYEEYNTHQNDEQIANLRMLLEANTRQREAADAAVQKATELANEKTPGKSFWSKMSEGGEQARSKFDAYNTGITQDAAKQTDSRVKKELDAIEMEESRGKLSHAAKIQRLQAVVQMAGITGEQRVQIEKMIAREEGASAKEVARVRAEAEREAERAREERLRKEEQDRQARLNAEADLKAKLRQIYGETTQDKISDVEEQVKHYQQAGLNEVDIERYRSGAIKKIRDEEAEAAKRAADEKARDQQKVNDGVQKEINLRDQLSERIKKTQFSGVGQSIQDAFKDGNFGFSLDTSLIGKMNPNAASSQPSYGSAPAADQPKVGPGEIQMMRVNAPAAGGEASAPASSSVPVGGSSASVPTSAETIIINASTVVVNGRQGGVTASAPAATASAGGSSFGSGAGLALDRDSFFSKGR